MFLGGVDPFTWTDCKLAYYLFYVGKHCSSTLLVLMSMEKCFAVFFPLKSKIICTVKTAKWATGIVGFVFAGYDSVYFFAMKAKFIESSGTRECVYVGRNYFLILNTVDSVLYSSGPFTLILIFNLAIALKFMAAKCESNSSSSTESTNQALAKSATRGTAMVVTVSVTFLLLTAPSAVAAALYRWYFIGNNVPLYRAYMNLTQYLNHSINGILYCIVGSRFRGEILKIFGQR